MSAHGSLGAEHREYQLRHYDEHYPRHAAAVRQQLAHPLFRSFNDRIARRVLHHGGAGLDSRPLRLLEVACGEGLLASALRRVADERGLDLAYTGTDLSAAGVELAKESVDGEFLVGDAIEVLSNLPPASHDIVVAKNLLHHLDDPAPFLRQAARVAGRSGRVVLVEARLGCLPFLLVTLLFFPRRERHFFKGRGRNLVRPVREAGLWVRHAERFSCLPWELAFAIRVDWFRRLWSTSDPETIRKVTAFDDWLAAKMPWGTCYEVWVTVPAGASSNGS